MTTINVYAQLIRSMPNIKVIVPGDRFMSLNHAVISYFPQKVGESVSRINSTCIKRVTKQFVLHMVVLSSEIDVIVVKTMVIKQQPCRLSNLKILKAKLHSSSNNKTHISLVDFKMILQTKINDNHLQKLQV